MTSKAGTRTRSFVALFFATSKRVLQMKSMGVIFSSAQVVFDKSLCCSQKLTRAAREERIRSSDPVSADRTYPSRRYDDQHF